jgi:hypothetical protein
MEAQRYPDDFDGFVVGAPAMDKKNDSQWHAWLARINTAADGTSILASDKFPALNQAVVNACGRLDHGIGDMLQDHHARKFDARSLICTGADSSSCLTPGRVLWTKRAGI